MGQACWRRKNEQEDGRKRSQERGQETFNGYEKRCDQTQYGRNGRSQERDRDGSRERTERWNKYIWMTIYNDEDSEDGDDDFSRFKPASFIDKVTPRAEDPKYKRDGVPEVKIYWNDEFVDGEKIYSESDDIKDD